MALIWCEDQKGLVTYDVPDANREEDAMDSGDLVEFDVIDQREFRDRKAINLRVSGTKVTTDLGKHMAKEAGRIAPRVHSSAEFGNAKFELTKK